MFATDHFFAPHGHTTRFHAISYMDGLISLLGRFVTDPDAMNNVSSVIPGRIYVVKGERERERERLSINYNTSVQVAWFGDRVQRAQYVCFVSFCPSP